MKELQEIQHGLKAPKGQFNNFGKYYYRSCEDILEAVKPLLAQFNCTLTLSDDIVTLGGRIYVKATATIKNDKQEAESVSGFAREADEKKGMDVSQITGAASSYARKYALNGLFCIDDTKDADFTNNGNNGKSVAQSSKQPKQDEQLAKLKTLIGSECFSAKERNDFREMYAEGKTISEILEVVEREYAAKLAWDTDAMDAEGVK